MLLSNGEVVRLAPQALAETTPLLNTGYWYATDGLQLEHRHATYAALYRSQPWVFTVIDKVSVSVARLGIQVWDNSPDNGKVLDSTSAYAKVIKDPCPTMSAYAFWHWIASTYELYGEAYLLKSRDKTGKVVGLYPMHPTRTAVKRDQDGNEVFVFQVGVASAGILTAPAEDVIPFRRYNPDTTMRGLSRLEPLRSTLMNEDGARTAAASWWRNMGRPSMILSTDKILSQDGRTRLKASWDSAQSGAGRAGGAAVLEDGVKATPIQLSAEELQYIESRKLNREEVCATFDVPPPVVHILDNATFSNITEQMRSMYRDTMMPRLEDLESILDHYLRPEFDGTGKLEAKFATADVLRGDFETRAAAVVPMVANGIMQPNEARPLFDLPLSEDENANKLFINSAIQPLGTLKEQMTIRAEGDTEMVPGDELLPLEPDVTQPEAGTQPPSPAPTQPQAAKALKTIRSTSEYRAVMGRLGRKSKTDATVLRGALVDEHRSAVDKHFEAQSAAAQLGVQVAGSSWDPSELANSDWNAKLTGTLTALSAATSKANGDRVATALGGSYDDSRLIDWLQKSATTGAENINAATVEHLKHALATADDDADPADVVRQYFDGIGYRSAYIAGSRVTQIGNLAGKVAADQNDAATKTWVVTSERPRASHEARDGQTIPLDELFDGVMDAPGDPAGGPGETDNCTCVLDFS